MELRIRDLDKTEKSVLDKFLYLAIFVPEGAKRPDYKIINQPELSVYIRDFFEGESDTCVVADDDGRIVGAAWTRIMNDYGHIGENIPSLAISVLPEYSGQKIGTKLMGGLLKRLETKGFEQVSLSEFMILQIWSIVKQTDEEYK